MSIPSWARVGAKVVCVDAGPGPVRHSVAPLVKGTLYTIASTEWGSVIEAPIIRIVESRGRFGLFRFRPLVTRTQEQDISAYFKPLLSPERIDA